MLITTQKYLYYHLPSRGMRVHRGVRPVGRGRLTAVIHLEALYVTSLFIKFKCIDIALNREESVKVQNSSLF